MRPLLVQYAYPAAKRAVASRARARDYFTSILTFHLYFMTLQSPSLSARRCDAMLSQTMRGRV